MPPSIRARPRVSFLTCCHHLIIFAFFPFLFIFVSPIFPFLDFPSYSLIPLCYHSTLLSFGCFVAEKSIKKAEAVGVGGGGGVRIGTGGRAEDMYPRRHSIIPERAPKFQRSPSPTRTPWTNDPRGRKFTRTARYREKSLL